MSYERQTFTDHETVLMADNLEHIEDGIIMVEDKADLKVNKPENSPGTAGQLLQTDGDGTTTWVDGPTDEQITSQVNAWLANHPEATTTVTDKSIGYTKLTQDVSDDLSSVADNTGAEAIHFTLGGYIDASNETLTFEVREPTNYNYKHAIVDCREGDVFTINGKASTNVGGLARVWCFARQNGERLDVAKGGITVKDLVITAPENAEKLVISLSTLDAYCFKEKSAAARLNELTTTTQFHADKKAWNIGSYNRFDKTTVTVGSIDKFGVINQAQTNWRVSDYIPVNPGMVLYGNYYSPGGFALYDMNGYVVNNSQNWANPFVVPQNVYYIRMSFQYPQLNNDAYLSTVNYYDAYLGTEDKIHNIDNSAIRSEDLSSQVLSTVENASDVDITDAEGNVILRLADGHIQTKEFNSATMGKGVTIAPTDATASVDLDVTDASGNVIVRVEDGYIKTKEFDSSEVPTQQDIDDLHDEIEEEVGRIIGFEVGKNLIDPSKRVTGYILSSGNITTSDSYANYSTSDFVELEANTDYAFAGFGASSHSMLDYNRVACLLFDADKAPISGTYQDYSSSQAGGKLTFNSGSTAKYARVTTKTDAIFQLEKGTTVPTTYEEYSGRDVLVYPLGETPLAQSQRGNVLYGKKWAVCGDSFTDGATSTQITDDGIYKGYRYVYPYLIGNRNDMKIVRFFNGGETLAFPAEPGTFTNSLTYASGPRYYQNIPADADYITIYLGINDANHASGSSIDGESTEGVIPLGEITDTTVTSYYGAWNVVLSWLIENRPRAHIGIIVCNGISSTDTYRQAQIAIAKKYGIPYIDLNGDSRTPSMHRTCNPDIAQAVKDALLDKWSVSSTNSHPNDAAHMFESMFIENFLRTI